MRPLILCRERLNRVLQVLEKHGGTLSVRDCSRRYALFSWELEQAESLGWITILEQKPPVGRPSFVARKLSECHSAKLPPFRSAIAKEISIRHWLFAMNSTDCMNGGRLGLKMATAVHAYLKTFPEARSRSGAYASASRLMKRRDVRLARLWFQRTTAIRTWEPMPATVDGIVQRLRELDLI